MLVDFFPMPNLYTFELNIFLVLNFDIQFLSSTFDIFVFSNF